MKFADELYSHRSHSHDHKHTGVFTMRQIQPSFESSLKRNVFGRHGKESCWRAVQQILQGLEHQLSVGLGISRLHL